MKKIRTKIDELEKEKALECISDRKIVWILIISIDNVIMF